MPRVEGCLDRKHNQQDDTESSVRGSRWVSEGLPRDNDEDSSDEKKGPKPAEKVHEQFVHNARWRRGGTVGTMRGEQVRNVGRSVTNLRGGLETFIDFIEREGMPLELLQFCSGRFCQQTYRCGFGERYPGPSAISSACDLTTSSFISSSILMDLS